MFRRGPWCDFHCANHYMGLSRTTALRPRDWPKDMVVRAAEFAARLPEPAGSFAMTYLHFLDGGDWQRALTWLDKAHQAARAGSKLALRTDHRSGLPRSLPSPRWTGSPAPGSSKRRRARIRSIIGAPAPPCRLPRATCQARQPPGAKPGRWPKNVQSTGINDMDREQLRLVRVWLEELRAQPVSA